MSEVKSNIHKLNQLQATAICGNDISSSCLYVSALTIIYAGQYAWVSLLIVALVLYLFRKIYGEVVGALPLNGGAYNVLLNTASKRLASVAACLTILSYMATAVISAHEAMYYLSDIHSIPLIPSTILLLAIFMMLAIIGIGESAIVAVIIFILHLVSLSSLVLAGIWYLLHNGWHIFTYNWQQPVASGSLVKALFFGFSAAMLGISGFESSANFVEEQQIGVFRKTLRNMWAVVSFFNPVIALLALSIIPLGVIGSHQESLLSFMGQSTGGAWLGHLISIDAVLVLSGAVLTSYVGVTGLAERITLDRILPNFLLAKNKRGISYRIVVGFFVMCVSILLVTRGNLADLAGVYTFSFLTVMALFGIGNLLLKIKRRKLPRPEKAPILSVMLAVALIIAAFFGNMKLNLVSFYVFIKYLIPALLFTTVMLNRARIIRAIIYMLKYLYRPFRGFAVVSNKWLERTLVKVNSQELVFFTKGDNVETINNVLMYIEGNETTKKLKIVNVKEHGTNNAALKKDVEVLDRAYPHITIDFIELEGAFGPELIQQLSNDWHIPKNFMFIGSPGNRFPYQVSELGGVRLIM
ncbi:APC family permease [Mucilaginibacter agri]|uniref:Amino acid permease n=1 Tax=Mucilaginibacter agri TaxID=2695265 RepID=A0A965ZFF6_9SPHI|nr:APC family permease [Mucilaginibacter agri]NCD70053.1 amino acid permease [Mucilaginibacter agri]